MNNKVNNKATPIIIVMICIAILVTMSVVFFYSQNNSEPIEYEKYTTVVAKDGKEYTTTDQYGNLFDVKKDGMYCHTDFGTVKVKYDKPINKCNTYTYVMESGSNFEFTLNKDKTYTYTAVYADGSGFDATGKWRIDLGIDAAFSALKIKDNKEFSDAFLYQTGAINPNDLFVLTLEDGEIEYFDTEGNKVKYAASDYHNSFEEIGLATSSPHRDTCLDRLVIYLYKDADGNTQAVAYNTEKFLLMNENNVNGKFSVVGKAQRKGLFNLG